MNFRNLLSEYGEYSDFCAALKKGKTPISAAGIVESAAAQFIYETAVGKKTLIITYSDLEAKQMAENLNLYTDKVFMFPTKEYIFFDIDARDHNSEYQRLQTIYGICDDSFTIVSLEALLEFTITPENFQKYTIHFSMDGEYELEELSEKLVKMGYSREEEVFGKGQFALRGGILDVFSPQCENPFRIEFFDTQVDSIREFDPMTQRSISNAIHADIIPCSETAGFNRDELISKLENELNKLRRRKTDVSKLTENIEKDTELLKNGAVLNSLCKYIGLIYDRIPTVLNYFDENSYFFLMEPKRISERAKSFEWEQGEIIDDLSQKELILPGYTQLWAKYSEIAVTLQKLPLISVSSLTHSSIDYTYNSIFNFSTRTTVSLHGQAEYLYEDLRMRQKENETVIVLASNRSRGENLAGTLNDKGIKCRYIHGDAEFEKGEIVILRGTAGKGFEYPELKFILISEQEIFEAAKKKRASRKVENASRLKSYTDINPGDYVVHRSHGIGKYLGIKKMSVGGITKDYLHIAYRGTDSLYVPVDQLDMLYKYSGATDKELRLNKLGGTEWNKTKQRVRASTKDMAKQLAALYAERERTKGHAYSSDTPWQREFEDTFPYQETEDQLRSIEEVKRDMESSKPMDRLLCGDVGYGKTEVAIRAAFKAAADSKQVAYLCPTTILAMQQYETFTKRMKNFPIKIEMLSRFRTAAEQKQILKKLKTGEIDIIIGTHRILQKDLEFKDLGLLIIDEEQRFGVAHKEKLKEMKKNVDVLSMSATPIPRTLHMAMVSVRDMSVLETPPENRYPVATYVLEFNADVVIDAIKKELSRGGQVFYLFNRVRGIYRVAEWIKSQLPDANVAVGHGKMKEDELEDIMYDMVNGDTDILVCTTIIETGLDIPNANTIIIEDSDRMGLAQLYQLRGRVGRSARSAYAYLTYKKDGSLSETAEKRLLAIREFTEFGSGFKIAMRDLEIRGAGDILGAEQHGHIDSVGYDMYCKILADSVKELQGENPDEDIATAVDIKIDAFIPERYIKSNNVRIDTYKRIAAIETEDDASEVTDELIDRFGDLPRAAVNLIEIAQIKALAHNIGITDVSHKDETVLFTFAENKLLPEYVQFVVKNYSRDIVIDASGNPVIKYRVKNDKKLTGNIKFLLQQLNELHIDDK